MRHLMHQSAFEIMFEIGHLFFGGWCAAVGGDQRVVGPLCHLGTEIEHVNLVLRHYYVGGCTGRYSRVVWRPVTINGVGALAEE